MAVHVFNSVCVCVCVHAAVEEVCGKVHEELRSSVISGSELYIDYLEANDEEER